ncbi:MAG: hypothetical protein V3U57_07240 [Robiginitomaculum sp.]
MSTLGHKSSREFGKEFNGYKLGQKMGHSVKNGFKAGSKGLKSILKAGVAGPAGVAAVAGAAAGVGFAVLAKKALQSADDLQHFSQQVGVSAETLQEYTFIANRLGLSQSDMTNGFIYATKNLGQFRNTGAGPAAEAIKQLGLESEITNGKINDSGQFIDAAIRELSKMDNAAERAALAGKIFGERYGPKLNELMNQGAGGIAQMKAEARGLGLVLSNDLVKSGSDANDELEKMGEIIKVGLTGAILRLAPQIQGMAEGFIDQLPQIITWFEKSATALGGFGDAWNASVFPYMYSLCVWFRGLYWWLQKPRKPPI